jgi:hypothetical protein
MFSLGVRELMDARVHVSAARAMGRATRAGDPIVDLSWFGAATA